MNKLINTIIFISFIYNVNLYSQNEIPDIENIIEDISKGTDDIIEFDDIDYYHENKIDLRKANAELISRLPGVPYSVAIRIVDLVQNNVLDDIWAISDSLKLSEEQVDVLEYCTIIYDQNIAEKGLLLWRLRSEHTFEDPRGFTENKFRGSHLEIYNRMIYSGQNFDAGLLTNKVSGEVDLLNFYSGYFSIKNENYSIIAGDFSIEAGLGNVIWKSFGMRKGSDVISPVLDLGRGTRPYRSTIEYDFFRGLNFNYSYKVTDTYQWKFNTWVSYSPRSANVNDDGYVTSLDMTGLQRTDTEIAKKGKLFEFSTGGMAEINISNLKSGIILYYLNYDKEIISVSKGVFHGKSGLISSVYSIYDLNNNHFGTEISRDALGNVGFKAGHQYFNSKFETALNLRYFNSNYRSPRGYNFGESQDPANETGIYGGILYKGIDFLRASIYADIYTSITRTYGNELPVKGIDIFSEFRIRISKSNNFILRIKTETKDDMLKIEGDPYFFKNTKSSVRCEFKHHLGSYSYLRFRTEAVNVSFQDYKKSEFGILLFFDNQFIVYDIFRFGSRITYFNTDSYSSAIWQFEYILNGKIATVPLYGKGIRFYAFAEWFISEIAKVRFRYSILKVYDRDNIGSSWDEIKGDTKSVLNMQLDIKI